MINMYNTSERQNRPRGTKQRIHTNKQPLRPEKRIIITNKRTVTIKKKKVNSYLNKHTLVQRRRQWRPLRHSTATGHRNSSFKLHSSSINMLPPHYSPPSTPFPHLPPPSATPHLFLLRNQILQARDWTDGWLVRWSRTNRELQSNHNKEGRRMNYRYCCVKRVWWRQFFFDFVFYVREKQRKKAKKNIRK